MTGGWVEDNPDCVKELVKRGHDLGNHSEHHYDMTTISQEEKDSELKTVHDKVKKLTGYEMYLFRPPYGAYDNDVIKTAYAMHYYPIQWSVDSLDWKNYGVDSIITTVCNHKALAPGAIILCHNGAKYTADALDAMLTNLEEQGYKIVPISKLIMKKNYHMDADKLKYPLTVRRWQEGDWFIPYGMSGRKKVSDYLIDHKVPLPEKARQFVLLSGDEIVWLVGRRIDDRYRLTAETENVLRITKEII